MTAIHIPPGEAPRGPGGLAALCPRVRLAGHAAYGRRLRHSRRACARGRDELDRCHAQVSGNGARLARALLRAGSACAQQGRLRLRPAGSRAVRCDCRPVRRARIEFWLVNEQGEYDDAHRATVVAGRDGRYRFVSNRPSGYDGRPPHIHVRVTARGYRTLVTQHYPRGSITSAVFPLVLRRA
jgi:hypothetical protein